MDILFMLGVVVAIVVVGIKFNNDMMNFLNKIQYFYWHDYIFMIVYKEKGVSDEKE